MRLKITQCRPIRLTRVVSQSYKDPQEHSNGKYYQRSVQVPKSIREGVLIHHHHLLPPLLDLERNQSDQLKNLILRQPYHEGGNRLGQLQLPLSWYLRLDALYVIACWVVEEGLREGILPGYKQN